MTQAHRMSDHWCIFAPFVVMSYFYTTLPREVSAVECVFFCTSDHSATYTLPFVHGQMWKDGPKVPHCPLGKTFL